MKKRSGEGEDGARYGEHQVEDREIERFSAKSMQGILSILRMLNEKALLPEPAHHGLSQALFIFHQKHAHSSQLR